MANKLGSHIQYLDGRAKNLLHASQPGITKFMSQGFERETLTWYRTEVGGLAIGRDWTDDLAITTPTDTARRFVERILPRFETVWDLLDIIEADMNEWKQTHPDELKWHNEFTVEVIRLLRPRVPAGLLLAVGCFGIGNPANPADIVHFKDAVAAGDVFTTHEYSWPRMQDGVGHHCLRYRTMRSHLAALNDPKYLKPWYIGECGLDRGVAEPQQPGDWGGWRNVTDAADYADQLRWYRGQLDADDYMLGATIFNLGGGHDWRNFEIGETPEIERMLAEPGLSPRDILTSYVRPKLPEPPPPPPPEPPKEEPALQTVTIGGLTIYDVRDRFPFVNGVYATRQLSTITTFVQHHYGHLPSGMPTTVAGALKMLDDAHRYHTQTHKWPSIGYHLAVDALGNIYYLNHINLVTFHARSANDDGIGVLWIGTFGETGGPMQPPEAMLAATRKLYRALETELKRSLSLVGHYEAPTNATTCPGVNHWPATKQAILATPAPVTPGMHEGFLVGDGFAAFLRANPDAGKPRQDAWSDSFGNTYVWLTSSKTYPSGALLVWRRWLNQIRVVSWD